VTSENLSVAPTTRWAANTTYTATLEIGPIVANGITLGLPYSVTFTTAAVLAHAAPAVTETVPANGARDVSRTASIQVYFSEAMDLSSLLPAFSIQPALNGSAQVSSQELLWTPTSGFANATTYRVTISTAAVSLANLPMAAAYRFNFTVENGSTPTDGCTARSCPTGPTPTGPGIPAPALIALALAALGIAAIVGVWLRSPKRPGPTGASGGPPTVRSENPDLPGRDEPLLDDG